MADERVGLRLDVNVGNLRKEVRAATGEVIRLQQEFGQFSPEAIQAAARVAELKDQLKDAGELVAALDPGRKFAAVSGAIQTVTGSFAALQGAVGLLGVESEETQKQLLKVQSALALSEGISTILDARKSFALLGQLIKGQVVGAFTALRAAIGATGIGLLVIAVGTLAVNFGKIKKAILDTFPSLGNLDKLLDDLLVTVKGIGNAVFEFLVAPFQALSKLIEGDFEGALDNLKKGVQFASNFEAGAASERSRQQQRDADKKLEDLIKQREKELEVIQASGKNTIAAEREIIRLKQQLYRDDAEQQGELSQQLKVLNARAAKERSDAAKAEAEKAKALRDKQLEEQKQAAEAAAQLNSKLQQELSLISLPARQKELEELRLWYEEQRKIIEKGNGDLLTLNELYARKQGEISLKYYEQEAQKLVAALAVREEAQKAAQEAELERQQNQVDGLLAAIEGYSANIALDAQDRLASIDALEKQTISNTQLNEEQRNAILRQLSQARILIDEQEIAAKQQKLQLFASLGNALSDLAGRQTALGKSLALASTTIETYSAAQAAYRSQFLPVPTPDSPVRGAIAAAAAIASGLARVRQILSVKIPGTTIAAPSISAGVTAPLAPTPNVGVTQLAAASINDLGNRALRTYVLESDMTTSQARIRRIQRAAILGG